MTKLEITKKAVGFIIGAGVAKISRDIIANNINDPENIYQKVTVISGAAVVGMMAQDASKAYTSRKIDEIVSSFSDLKLKIEEAKQEKK